MEECLGREEGKFVAWWLEGGWRYEFLGYMEGGSGQGPHIYGGSSRLGILQEGSAAPFLAQRRWTRICPWLVVFQEGPPTLRILISSPQESHQPSPSLLCAWVSQRLDPCGEEYGHWPDLRVGITAPPLTSCLSLGKVLDICLHFSIIYKMWAIRISTSEFCCGY